MFVLTVDQVGSRHSVDRVAATTPRLAAALGERVLLGPDRTAGDEFQVLVADPGAALHGAFQLLREGGWSVGLGVGAVALPLPATTREAAGPAFLAARDAVDAAKTAVHRFALVAPDADALVPAAGVQALIDLVLDLRAARSAEGWEVVDLLGTERTQAAVAARLGITPQAVSLRSRAAGIRAEQAATPALIALLGALDAPAVVPPA